MNAKLEAIRIQHPPTQSSRLRIAATAGEPTADIALVSTAVEPAISPDSLPMGANIVPDKSGTTFRVWAPSAQRVYLVLNPGASDSYTPLAKDELMHNASTGHWTGFIRGVGEATEYKFWIVGEEGGNFKRDPYARELTREPSWPKNNCVVRDPNNFPWHDQDYRPPAFNDLVIYQFHIGAYFGTSETDGSDRRMKETCNFLDVLFKLEYLANLGVNAIEPLPVTEYYGTKSEGYNGSDMFSPEMDYTVPPGADLDRYLAEANRLLKAKRPDAEPFTAEHFEGQVNQLKVMVDLFHLYGIAVIFDVVYNHAGGFDGDDHGLYFFDRQRTGDNNRSLYFTDHGWANGLVFAYWQQPVCGFLIDDAKFFLAEYHADGLRHDEVRAAIENGGGDFCKDLTLTEHFVKNNAIEIAEYWRDNPIYAVKPADQGGFGFDAFWSDGLRKSIREVISSAAGGRSASVNMDAIVGALSRTDIPEAWRRIECVENHDTAYQGHKEYAPWRVASMAVGGDRKDSRSWYGRSRSRVATGLLLTGTGVPMLFMGQEFLEDKPWSDNPGFFTDTLIYWDGLRGPTAQKEMQDHLRFTQDLIWLRRRHPALRGEKINVFHVHNDNRIIAFHRWIDGVGRDVVVIASLREETYYNHSYQIGFPLTGHWNEVFNSDIYDPYFNHGAKGNYGGITADGPPMHGLPCSAGVTIPANGIVVFGRDLGDR